MTAAHQIQGPALAALRAGLLGAHFTVDGVHECTGEQAVAAMDRADLVPARRMWASQPLHATSTLARVFLAAQVEPVQRFNQALATVGLTAADFADVGLVAIAGDQLRAQWSLSPHHDDWFVVSDFPSMATAATLPSEYVLGVGGASRTLAQFQLHTPVSSTWDLGAGCGVQALHASLTSEQVIATDISARAITCTQMSAGLSDVALDARVGSYADPVAEMSFDRIISNPPFVMTPRDTSMPHFEYRDAGLAADTLLDKLLPLFVQHLNPGGTVQLLANWALPESGDWAEVLAPRLAAAGLDYWVVQRDVQDPAAYARLWLADAGVHDPAQADRLTDLWLTDFAQQGIHGVGFGLILLAHQGGFGFPLQRLEEQLGPMGAGFGEHVAGRLADLATWSTMSVAERAQLRFLRASDVTEERHYLPGDSDPQVILLRQTAGYGQTVPVSSNTAAVVGACDGELAFGQLCAAVAHLTDQPVAQVLSETLVSIEVLLWSGMVVLAK